MARIHRYELSDIIAVLPSPVKLAEAGSLTARTDDLFICALGFEDRCLAIPEFLSVSGYCAAKCVYCIYSTNEQENVMNRPKLEACLSKMSDDVSTLSADVPDFSERLRSVVESLRSDNGSDPPSVTFDISVVANRLLIRCMEILLQANISLRLVYSEAQVYHPTKEEYEANREDWISGKVFGLERGVRNVEPSCDHPGNHLDRLPDCLLVFPCFNAERSRAVMQEVDQSMLTSPDDRIVWFVGDPRLPEDRWRCEAMRKINHISKDVLQFEVATFDYRETLRVLENEYQKRWDRFNITLSPLGSKMQAVGAALFHYIHPDVRVMLATPREYNALRYTEKHKALWVVPFGETASLRTRLGNVGMISLEGAEARPSDNQEER